MPAAMTTSRLANMWDGAKRVWSIGYPFGRDIYDQFSRHHISSLAKQAAYSLLYAFPSMALALVSLVGLLDKHLDADLSDAVMRTIDERAPEALVPVLKQLVNYATVEMSQSAAAITTLILIGIALWSVAGSAGAIVYACNQVYGVIDERSYFSKKLLTLAMTAVGMVGLLLSMLMFASGRTIGEWIVTARGSESIVSRIFSEGRNWSLVLVPIGLFLLYVWAPNLKQSPWWLIPGTATSTLLVFLALALSDLILRLVNPGGAFGAASSVLVLLWFLYLLCVIVILGAQINAVCARRFDRTAIEYLAAHVDQQIDRPLH